MSRKLHEIGSDVDPQLSMRVASGKAGSATINSTWQRILDWLQDNLSIPAEPTIGIAEIEIGAWDMNVLVPSKQVNISSLGILNENIINVDAWIVPDQDFGDERYKLGDLENTGYITFVPTNNLITLWGGSVFQNTNYNSTARSRGWLVITYLIVS